GDHSPIVVECSLFTVETVQFSTVADRFGAYWCWYLLNRWLDVWGVRSSPDPTPDFFLRANLVAFASQAIDVISAVLIFVGAILLRRVASKPEPVAV
ncbi:MAG: hypothetical protein KDB60_05060, partial [Propionibacteriaceae bacterium]|nr:hypothetical protein [Propionibacteriaceae bacterium]